MKNNSGILFILCGTLLFQITGCKEEIQTHAYYYYEDTKHGALDEKTKKSEEHNAEAPNKDEHNTEALKEDEHNKEAGKSEVDHAVSEPQKAHTQEEGVNSAEKSLELLKEGNKRFVNGDISKKEIDEKRRSNLSLNGQKPFVAVLSCSDSRVPPEVLFDQALGDIFVIRDAGNVVDPVVLGSIEYGAEHLKVPLILVLGHEKCGAVKATVEGGEVTPNIGAIVEKIKKSFVKVKSTTKNKDELVENCCVENIKNSIIEIKKSHVINELEESKKVEVIGAKYDLDTGEVTYLKD